MPGMRRTLILATLALALALPAGPTLHAAGCAKEAEDAVRALLATQSAAWSRGDLAAFTSVYADDAAFLTPTGLTRGRQQVLERYRRRYPDRKAMGTLSLEVLEVRPFVTDQPCRALGASVAARWRLAYPDSPEKKTAEGLTLIVLRRQGDSWRILQDASM